MKPKLQFIPTMCMILALCLSFSLSVFAQQPAASKNAFKTGVVLSGGGAKGLAHIGLLQLIDSLEIQVDYITGSSMGAIVGAMYAVGYSADSINKIVSRLDWKYILSNEVPMNHIHLNEKELDNNSIISLPIKDKLPRIPKSVIEGQYLSEELMRIFFPARNIYHFHELPIAYEAVASDITSGETVVLKNGSLAESVRASMAIPVLFSPVYIDDHVLVDGGLTRNFPVEEVKKMGADFVIGSYTGFRKLSEKEINNMLNVISQSFAFSALEDAKKQMTQTDILLNLSSPLKEFNVQSFSDAKKIIDAGKKEAAKFLPQLEELKKRQMATGIHFSHKKITPQQVEIAHIHSQDIYGKTLNEDEQQTILAIMGKDEKQKLDEFDYLKKKIDNLFAHKFYNKIYSKFSANDSVSKRLNMYVRHIQPYLQVAIHYDNYESAGIILRYVNNNLWMQNARFLAEIDLSPFQKTRVSYLKYLDKRMSFWTEFSYRSRYQKYNDLLFKKISQLNYFTQSSVKYYSECVGIHVGYSPSKASAFIASLQYHNNSLTKHSGLLNELYNLSDSTDNAPVYQQQNYALSLNYNQNSLNANFFPTRGNKLHIETNILFSPTLNLSKPPEEDKIGMAYYEQLKPRKKQPNYMEPLLQLKISDFAALPLSRKVALHVHAACGINFRKSSIVRADEYLFLAQKFMIGGYKNFRFDGITPFTGLGTNEVSLHSLALMTLTVQYNAWRKLYISPSMSIASTLIGQNGVNNSYDNNHLWGVGIDFDYMTTIGPIKLSSAISNEFIPNLFFSIGYQF